MNAIAPDAILPPEGDNALTVTERDKILQRIPLRRFGHSDTICDALLFILGQDYMTDTTLRVDSGRHCT